MKAQELAGYFAKKIGKPIAYTMDETQIGGSFSAELTYAVEPIAVSDGNVLHALVTLKGSAIRNGTVKIPRASSGYYYPTARPDVVAMGAPALPLIGDIFSHTLSPAD